jgi:protein-tyrosine phosphatase
MRKVSPHELWIGHVGNLNDPRELLKQGVQAVVELADNEPMATLPRELIRCRFPITDGDEQRLWLLRLAAETTAALLRAQVPLLVCCSNGMSRSVCIAAAALVVAEGISPKAAISLVAGEGPTDISPALYNRVQEATMK